MAKVPDDDIEALRAKSRACDINPRPLGATLYRLAREQGPKNAPLEADREEEERELNHYGEESYE